jgi:hypothetical protein
MPEGHQVARITCKRCRHAVDVDPGVLKGLRGPRLFRALRCSECGTREANVSLRWECPPATGSRTQRALVRPLRILQREHRSLQIVDLRRELSILLDLIPQSLILLLHFV